MASVEGVSENLYHLPKKPKIDSLLLAIEKRDFAQLKKLVEGGAEVQETGSFKLNEHQTFENVPPLYAAMISGQGSMVNCLVSKYPKLVINPDDPDSLIQATDDVEQEIEVLELIGCALIFHGNAATREQGRQCWKKALELRRVNGIRKTDSPQSRWERLSFKNKREFTTIEELDALSPQRRKHWETQAFLVSKRILMKYECFPNASVVFHLYRFALKDWLGRSTDDTRSKNAYHAFAVANLLMELFQSEEFLDQLVLKPTESGDVLHLSIRELLSVLKWIQLNLNEQDVSLTFENLVTIMVFCRRYQLKVLHYGQIGAQAKEAEIKNVIVVILELLKSVV